MNTEPLPGYGCMEALPPRLGDLTCVLTLAADKVAPPR